MVRRAYPFAELSRELLDTVLDMLDGRYPSEEFAELRPRIVWDRVEDTIRARKGALQLAVTNAGTIPDRGLYGVHLPDGRRVGELDEEMVYEARPGQTFLLGASTWRIEEITRDRVIVTPAPGVPGAVPFWKGDGVGRPWSSGARSARSSREAVDREPGRAGAAELRPRRARRRATCPPTCASSRRRRASCRATARSWSSASATRSATGACACSRRSAAACTLPGRSRCRRASATSSGSSPTRSGRTTASSSTCPTPTSRPAAELVMVEPDELEELVVRELSRLGAVRRALPRERRPRAAAAARAYPGKRTPLWQQRLKAQSLLEVAKRYGQFPIVLETYRECLRDVFDLPGLEELLRGLHTRELSLVEVETQRASPFASSLLFDYVATYMYEGDTPNAERRAAALSLDRDLLRELLGQEELRELIDPAALAEVEADLQRRSERTRAANADALHDVLRAVGDLTADEAQARCLPAVSAERMLAELERERRAVRMRIGGEERWHRRRGRRPVPRRARRRAARRAARGLPRGRSRSRSRGSCAATRARTARSRPPSWRSRYAIDLGPVLRELERAGDLVRGELRPGGSEREWCDPEVLRRLRRASLATLRKEVEPAEQRALARFLPAWQGVDSRRPAAPASTGCARCSCRCRALALAPEVWERDVLPRRVGAYSPAWMDQLCASGELVWVGAGSLGRALGPGGALLPRGRPLARPAAGQGRARPAEPLHERAARAARGRRRVLDRPARRRRASARAGRAAGGALGPGLGRRGDQRRLRAAARAAPDAGQARSATARPPLRAPPPARRAAGAGPLVAHRAAVRGRARARAAHARASASCCWSATASSPARPCWPRASPAASPALYGELANLETLGTARRGYFVEGLGGAQFALPARDRAAAHACARDEPAGALVLAATDPANPYGATLPWPKREDESRPPASARARRLRRDARRRAGALRRARRQGPAAAARRRRRAGCARRSRRSADAVRRGRVPRLRRRALRRRAGRRLASRASC